MSSVALLGSCSASCTRSCTLPLTGKGVVDRIITDMCVFDVSANGSGFELVEISDEYSVDDVKKATGAPFKISKDLKSMENY